MISVDGGFLGDGAAWLWYSDESLSAVVGSGDTLEIMPDSSAWYYVRAEGLCNITDTASILVNVKVLSVSPDQALADISSFCLGEVDSISLAYSGGILGKGASAYWYNDPAFTQPMDSGNNIVIPAPAVTTQYFVRFEGDCNITGAANVQVYVGQIPEPEIMGDTVACESREGIFSVSGASGSGFEWSVEGGQFVGDSSGESVSVFWSVVGTGNISVTETNSDGCSAILEQTVTIHSSPTTTEILHANGVICAGNDRSYYIEGLENSSFEWVVEEGNIIEDYGDSIIINWDVPVGTYEVSVLETSENGCSGDTLRLAVTVEGPEINLGGDSHICEGEVFTIDLTGQYDTYLWQDGTTNPVFTIDSTSMISVVVGDASGCLATDSLYLEVHAFPIVELGNDTSICGDQGMVLDAGPEGIIYEWSTGDNSQEITIYMGEQQQISVTVVDEFGCSSSDTIHVDECDAAFYFRDIPTAITPNGDGVNDVWNIEKLSGYSRAEVEIFSRWGTMVWKSEPGYSIPWDGLDMNGNPVPMDSYHFVIKLNIGNKDRITGLITVIK